MGGVLSQSRLHSPSAVDAGPLHFAAREIQPSRITFEAAKWMSPNSASEGRHRSKVMWRAIAMLAQKRGVQVFTARPF